MDAVDELVLERIWSFLETEGLLTAACVCRRWRASVVHHLERLGLDGDFSSWICDYKTAEARYQRFCSALRNILAQIRKLRRLWVYEYSGGFRLPLEIVADNCPGIEAINLALFNLDAESLRHLCRKSPQLKQVAMPKEENNEDCLTVVLSQVKSLKYLDTGYAELDDEQVALLPTSLERLVVVDVEEELQDRLNSDLSNIQNLQVVSFTQGSVDIQQCHSLKSAFIMTGHYDLQLPSTIEHIYHPISDYELEHEKYMQLKTVVLTYPLPRTEALQRFLELSHLQCLKLIHFTLNEEVTNVLKQLTSLKELHVEDVNFPSPNKQSKKARRNSAASAWKVLDDDWSVVADVARSMTSLVVLALFGCVDTPTEPTFLALAELLQPERSLTLYVDLEDWADRKGLPTWGYNVDPTGRIRLRGEHDWRREFPHLIPPCELSEQM